MDTYHTSVLLQEVITTLQVKPGKRYIDATLGGGGHTVEIIKQGGIVLGIDTDEEAIDFVKDRITNYELRIKNNLVLRRGNFRDIDKIAKEERFEEVAGILFDLGVSSHQLKSAERGFSFLYGGPLDMRMDQTLKVQAKDLLKVLSKRELTELFSKFGEERFAGRIAQAIVNRRQQESIETTRDLEQIIKKAVPRSEKMIHPATRVFQALRIAVNDELFAIQETLPKALSLLNRDGRIIVISFHSLEDRIIKKTFNTWESEGLGVIITKKPIGPSDDEIERNRRSRSAKLRVFEKK